MRVLGNVISTIYFAYLCDSCNIVNLNSEISMQNSIIFPSACKRRIKARTVWMLSSTRQLNFGYRTFNVAGVLIALFKIFRGIKHSWDISTVRRSFDGNVCSANMHWNIAGDTTAIFFFHQWCVIFADAAISWCNILAQFEIKWNESMHSHFKRKNKCFVKIHIK